MYSETYKLKTVIARFFNVYGPRHPSSGPYATVVGIFEELTKNKKPLTVVGDGEQRRDFTHVDDICSGLMAISRDDYKGEVFNLGTGINYSINELATFFGGERVYLSQRPGETRNTLADISKTAKLTYWQPIKNLQDYIKEWFENINYKGE
jgi:UDP-glucose 4-epimerase